MTSAYMDVKPLKVRKTQPAAYMKICALLVPREMKLEHCASIGSRHRQQLNSEFLAALLRDFRLPSLRVIRQVHLAIKLSFVISKGGRAREGALAAYPGHPAFTPAGATATPMAPPRSIALCKKPDTRTSSINALTAASAAGRSFGTTIFCGTLNRSSGNSLVPGVAVASVVRRWRLAPSASIVRAVSALLNSAGLFSSSTIVACLRMRFMHSVIESLTVPVDLLSRAVDIGDRLDGRAVE